MDPVIVALALSLVSGVLSLLLSRFTSLLKKEDEQKREVVSQESIEAQINLVKQVLSDLPEESLKKYINYLTNSQLVDGSFPESPFGFTYLADLEKIEEIGTELESRYLSTQKQVDEIKKRFPEEATLEKIADVNDAILAFSFR